MSRRQVLGGLAVTALAACGSAPSGSAPSGSATPTAARRSSRPIAHVVVGPMVPADPSLGHVSDAMRAAAIDELRADGRFVVGANGPGAAYYLDGSLSGYDVDARTLHCTVHLVVATHPEQSILAMPDGAAASDADPSHLAPAQRACAGEVVRALVRGTVIPYLARRAAADVPSP